MSAPVPTSHPTPASTTPRKRSGQMAGWIVLALLVVAGLIFRHEVQAMACMHVLGPMAYPNGVDSGSGLTNDDLKWLTSIPPTVLSKYLTSPSPESRAMACQALAMIPVDQPGDWSGVNTQLVELMHSPGQGGAIHSWAGTALKRAPPLQPAELAQLFDSLDKRPDTYDRTRLLEFLLKQPLPDDSTKQTLTRWTESADPALRRDAAVALISKYADVERAQAVVRALLKGSAAEKVAAFELVLIRHFEESGNENQPANGGGKSDAKLLDSNLTKDVLAAAQSILLAADVSFSKAAVTAGKATTDAEKPVAAALDLLQAMPDGAGVLLTAGLKAASPNLRLYSLQWLPFALRSSRGKYHFSKEQSNALVDLLQSEDREIRREAALILRYAFAPVGGRKPIAPFVANEGPLDPSRRQTFEKLTNDPVPEVASLSLPYFRKVHPKETPTAELLVSVIKIKSRDLRKPDQIYPQFPPAEVDAYRRMVASYPNDPRAVEASEAMAKDSADPALILVASKHLMAHAPDKSAALKRIHDRYHALRTDPEFRRSPVRGEFIQFFFDLGQKHKGLEIANLGAEVWAEVIERWVTSGTRDDSMQGKSMAEEAALLGPATAKNGMTLALDEFFATYANTGKLDRFAGQVGRFLDVPEGLNCAEAAITKYVASKEARARLVAVRFLTASKGRVKGISDDALATLLDDSDRGVQIAAADALGARHAAIPKAVDGLRGLVTKSQDEQVRAAGLRNLVILKPNDAEVIQMAQSLVNDPAPAVRAEARETVDKNKEAAPKKT